MSTKGIAVIDDGTDLVPAETRKRPAPAPASSRGDHDLDVGGSNVGTTSTDDAFALDYDDGGEDHRQIAKRDDVADPSFPKVRGHRWQPEDVPILESFAGKAAEIGLTAKQSNSLAEWFLKDAQVAAGAPTDVEDFEFSAEGIEDGALGRAMSNSFKQFALNAGMPVGQADGVVNFFINESQAQISKWDAEHRAEIVAECSAEWGADHGRNIKETRAYLDSLGEVGRVLKNARTASGKRLIYESGVPQFLHEAAMREKDPDPETSSKPTLSDTTALRKEASSIRALREKDREAYHREWKNSGLTASDRLLEIEKELEGKARGVPSTSPAARARDLADERRELLRLEKVDPESFEHGRWRDSKITPSERLHQIVSKGR